MNKLILFALAGACMSTPALANLSSEMKMKTEKHFLEMDTDNDKRVSRAEHEIFSNRMFESADANNDGVLTQQEMMDHKESMYMKSPAAGGPLMDPPGETGDPQRHPY